MKIIWTLHYDRSVTSFLSSIRGTEKAKTLRETIKALQFKTDPTEGCISVPDIPNGYEFECVGHWVGLQIVTDNKSVRVLYITIGGG